MTNSDIQELKDKVDQVQKDLVYLKGLISGKGKELDQWKDEKARLEDRLLAMVNQNAFLVQKIDELEGITQEREKSIEELKQEREKIIRESQEIIKELESRLKFFPVRVILKLRRVFSSE